MVNVARVLLSLSFKTFPATQSLLPMMQGTPSVPIPSVYFRSIKLNSIASCHAFKRFSLLLKCVRGSGQSTEQQETPRHTRVFGLTLKNKSVLSSITIVVNY